MPAAGEVTRRIDHAARSASPPGRQIDRAGVGAFKDKVVKANVGGVQSVFKANNDSWRVASFTGKNTVSLKKKEGGTEE